MIHIMMATYNGEKYIREQIDSILQQTYTEWRLYISDDGSADRTVAVIEQYQKNHPEKIVLLNHDTNFHSAKENFAFLYRSVPDAEYYAFCDQDDIWEKDKLECMMAWMPDNRNDEPVLVYHDMKIITEIKTVIAGSFVSYFGYGLNEQNALKQILLYNVVPGCAMVFNDRVRELIREIPGTCIMHDWWILLGTLCMDGRVIFCEKKLSLYRQHGENQVGAIKIKKKGLLKTLILCLDILNLPYYRNNNRRMKSERIAQTQAMIDVCGSKMDDRQKDVLKEFLKLLTDSKKLHAYWYAKKNGYILLNKINTLKFFLL